PSPGPKELLIKNEYVASNPKDWKLHDSTVWDLGDRVEGNDVAGYVDAIGEGTTRFQVGDRVAGFSMMATDDKYGAYAEYTVVPEGTTFALADHVKFEEAVTLPLAAMTAAIALFVKLDLPKPKEVGHGKKPAVFINGGSSSVGHFAVQLAKAAGLYVITTAGGSSELPKSAGADVIIDYRGKTPDAIAKEINEAAQSAGHTLNRVFDAISEDIVRLSNAVLKDKEAAKTTFILQVSEKDEQAKDPKIAFVQTNVGAAHAMRGDDHQAFATEYYDWLGEKLAEGTFKGNPVKLMPKGLASIGEGLNLLKQNKVSGQKLVYRISDTP
ncbi:chaperonin 10-like protein, partial [Protomyces lactucae-debilis]